MRRRGKESKKTETEKKTKFVKKNDGNNNLGIGSVSQNHSHSQNFIEKNVESCSLKSETSLDEMLQYFNTIHQQINNQTIQFELFLFIYFVTHLFIQNYNVYRIVCKFKIKIILNEIIQFLIFPQIFH